MAKPNRTLQVSFTTDQWAALLDLLKLDGDEVTAALVLARTEELATSEALVLSLSNDAAAGTDAKEDPALKALLSTLEKRQELYKPTKRSPDFGERRQAEVLGDEALQRDADERARPTTW